jgi:ubiquinone/menaquinone biosynthesis C-methylase UbiE
VSSHYIHGTDAVEQQRLAALNRLTNDAFLAFLELSPTDRVLEVGCGLAILADAVASRVPDGEVIGAEISAEQLAAARPAQRNVRLRPGNALALPFDDAEFDVVYCRYLLEHVPNPLRALEEMRRVLRPGGRVFVQENNILVNVLYPECPRFDSVWQRFAELQTRLGGDALIGKKLFALLQKAGFQAITLSVAPEIHSAGSAAFEWWIVNLIQNVRGAERELVSHDLVSAEGIDAAEVEMRELLRRPDASAYFYWNRAKARK